MIEKLVLFKSKIRFFRFFYLIFFLFRCLLTFKKYKEEKEAEFQLTWQFCETEFSDI